MVGLILLLKGMNKVAQWMNNSTKFVMSWEKRGLLTVTWCHSNLTSFNKNFVWSRVLEKFLRSFHEGVWICSVINLSLTLCIGDVWLPAVSIAMFWGVPTNCKELAYRVFIKRVLNSTLLAFPLPWPVLPGLSLMSHTVYKWLLKQETQTNIAKTKPVWLKSSLRFGIKEEFFFTKCKRNCWDKQKSDYKTGHLYLSNFQLEFGCLAELNYPQATSGLWTVWSACFM